MFVKREEWDRYQFLTGLFLFAIAIGYALVYGGTGMTLADWFYGFVALVGGWFMLFSNIEINDEAYFKNEEEHGQH